MCAVAIYNLPMIHVGKLAESVTKILSSAPKKELKILFAVYM